MNRLRTLRNYIVYCGIEKEDYNAVKKDAYVSNFRVWRVLHYLMAAVFGALFLGALYNPLLATNFSVYLLALLYSALAIAAFRILRQDSILAQFLIYGSMSMLFLFACAISRNRPDIPAATFIVFLVLSPMFMIDKPFFMAIELCAASAVFLVWMHRIKPEEIWEIDFANAVTFTVVGVFLNVIANAIRIREFVLTREIRIQKDTDDLTGLKNKGALTREINAFLADGTSGRGVLLMLDIDRFKSINDTYGHDVGDSVIRQLGAFLGGRFTGGEVVGRFGGDEFIVFLKNTDDLSAACGAAAEIIAGAAERIRLPDAERAVSLSVGIAPYSGREKNYSEIFKMADVALYRAKADPDNRFRVYE